MSSTSFERLLLKNQWPFSAQEPKKISENHANFLKGAIMKTGLTKRQKTTHIFFDEQSSIIEVQTYNTNLKNRLTKYAVYYPNLCKQTDDDEQGGLTFEIEKGRFGFKLTAPYSERRRKMASELAKKNGIRSGR